MKLMQRLCIEEYQKLFGRLKYDIVSRPTLARPDSSQRFDIKIDWYKDGMGALIFQAED